MKKLSRIIAGLSTAAVMAVSAVSFSGSAAQTIRCNDPNADGVIDISDAITIRQYLAGGITPSNVDALDFDNNGVVTQMDAYKVQLSLVKLLNVQMNSSNPTAVSPQGDPSVSYRVYNAKTGSEITSKRYTLTEAPEYNNSRTVIGGTDDRVIDWSKSGVVKIINSDGSFGSGFVVGEHTIATAAHCVYNTSTKQGVKVSSVKLFNTNGTSAFDATPVESHIPLTFINEINANVDQSTNQYDYALITVKEDLSDYMCFDLGVALNKASTDNISITNTGFPGTIRGTTVNNTSNKHNMYQCTGSLIEANAFYPERQLFYNCDTSGGNSGGPVYTTSSENGEIYYSVIAINVSGAADYNIGTRITTELLRFYENNNNLSW